MISESNLAVCSWSLRPESPQDLLDQLSKTGIKRLQIALDPFQERPGDWSNFPDMAAFHGVVLVSGMFGTVGEDYTSLESIKQTGGVVPDATWDKNWRNIQQAAKLADRLGLKVVTFHAGFLPHEKSAPNFQKLLKRVAMIADLFAERGIELGLETGQETAEALKEFLILLGKKNVGVNFDPANIILYGNGDPVAALKQLGPWLKQCHIKDASRARMTGKWGEEVAIGTGQVDWKSFFQTINQLGYKGNYCIEREAGEQRVADILSAREFLAENFQ